MLEGHHYICIPSEGRKVAREGVTLLVKSQTGKLLMELHSYPIGQNLVTLPHLAARESLKCSLKLHGPAKNVFLWKKGRNIVGN